MSNRTTKMVGAGVAPMTAGQIAGDVQLAVTAAGTTQATAAAVYGDLAIVTTAAAGAGVIMAGPAFGPGDTQTIINQGANALLVYPPTGGQINVGGLNAAFSVGAGKSVDVHAATGLQFYTVLSA